ncbi:MAG: hypothetical protein JSS07_01470 [Proteobacteria bacterium]|nr:hypothetical protein [Pseudomonadota bacterium]
MQYFTLAALLLLQFHAATQALQRGYPLHLSALIFFIPLLGPLVFWLREISLLTKNYANFMRHFRSKANLLQELMTLQQQVRNYPTIENQQSLAKLYQSMGKLKEALFLLENLLIHKSFATDPFILLEKAKVHFALSEFVKTKETLDFLLCANPRFRCLKVDLLYARTLSELGAWQQANQEFEILQIQFHGLEASYYYLQHLQKMNNPLAFEILSMMRYRFARLPQHYRSSQKTWLKQAESAINRH